MTRVLAVWFREAKDGWDVKLCPEGRDPQGGEWRPWSMPTNPDGLTDALFATPAEREWRDMPWRVRTCPAVFGQSLPPVVSWGAFTIRGVPAVSKDYSIHEVTEHSKEAWTCEGIIAVVDDRHLARSLELAGFQRVVVIALEELHSLPAGAIVVVPGRVRPYVNAIQRSAEAQRCPLVVWCDTYAPMASRDLVEAVTCGSTPCKYSVPECARPDSGRPPKWLRCLLREVLKGTEPDLALGRALGHTPDAEPLTRWLRGPVRPWSVRSAQMDPRVLLFDWRDQIDRTRAQEAITHAANSLAFSTSETRVHVHVTLGEPDAGLDYFRRRGLNMNYELANEVRVEVREPSWPPQPRHALDAVGRTLDPRGFDNVQLLRNRLNELVPRGRLLLLHIQHATATTDDPPDSPRNPGNRRHPRVTFDDLEHYFAKLSELAKLLETHTQVRVLVCLYVATRDPNSVEKFVGAMQRTGTFAVKVTRPALTARVDDADLPTFLKEHCQMDPLSDDEVFEITSAAERCSYEDLVDWLITRFPKVFSRS